MKIRKILTFYLIFLCFFNVSIVYADDEDDELDYSFVYEETVEDVKESISEPKILSRSAVIYDRDSKQVIWGKQENLRVPMASTTKIMTAIILLEHGDLNQVITVDRTAAGIGGSRLGLHINDSITLNDLLYGLLICSGNDAAVQIAISIAGSVAEFSEIMNQKASELGLLDTHFVTPHGLDKEEHYTTAYELAVITDYAMQIEKFREVVGSMTHTVTISGNPRIIRNTNELLGHINGVNGVKTGFTNKARKMSDKLCNKK